MFGIIIESTHDRAQSHSRQRHRHSRVSEMVSKDDQPADVSGAAQTGDRHYWTSRDWRTSARLRLQHYLIQDQFKWLIHPSISKPVAGEYYRVLDIGCGNGSWLIELAPELPTANLVGLDISGLSFPYYAFRPQNVILHTFDIFNDNFPPGFREGFDLINMRALITVLPKGDPKSILERVQSLLKPGGYLQWVDCDDLDKFCCVEPLGSETGSESCQKILKLVNPWLKGRQMSEEAFQDWETKYKMMIELKEAAPIPKHLFQGWTEAALQVLEDYAERFPQNKEADTDLSKPEYHELLAKVYEETGRGGVAINLKEYFALVAKKV